MRLTARARRAVSAAVVACGAMSGGMAAVALTASSHASATAAPPARSASSASSGSTHEGLAQPVVGGASSSSGNGWWAVASDGGVFGNGDAQFLGSTGGMHLNSPVVGMAATRSGHGYWLVAADGGIFSFGDAAFHGSTGGMRLNSPIVAMASTRSSQGYWLVAADGGIFSFGDAAFHGSTGAIRLASPIVGLAVAHGGGGYWLVAADGGVFAFGEAPFAGSAAGVLGDRAVGLTATPGGGGYWIAARSGQVIPFGDARDLGNATGAISAPVVTVIGEAGPGIRLIGADTSSVGLSPAGIAVSTVAVAPATSNSYTWMVTNDDGSPARFNPCTPIHYVMNVAEGPAGAAGLVAGAFARLSAATGMTFVSDGITDEVPTSNRQPTQARYGPGWAPILVAWARPSETDLLPGGNTIGEGGSWWVMPGTTKTFVTGAVVIDPNNTAGLLASFGAGSSLGELLLHELGHVIGLGHTADPTQIMFATLLPIGNAGYGAGDLTGLRILGRASGCLPEPTP